MKILRWFSDRFRHKLSHFSLENMKLLFKKHGISLVIIIVAWEILEDILFPLMFAALGKYAHPIFYGGIPISWLLCLHWLAVPIIWGAWLKFGGNVVKSDKDVHDHCGHDH